VDSLDSGQSGQWTVYTVDSGQCVTKDLSTDLDFDITYIQQSARICIQFALSYIAMPLISIDRHLGVDCTH